MQKFSPILCVAFLLSWQCPLLHSFQYWWSLTDLFSFTACAFAIVAKKPLPTPTSRRFTIVFPSESFMVLALAFRYLIHFDLWLWEKAGVQFHSLAWGHPAVPAPLSCLGTLVTNQLTVSVRIYFCALNSIPFISMSVVMPTPYCLDYCSFVQSSESESVSPPTEYFPKILLVVCFPCTPMWSLGSSCQFLQLKAADIVKDPALNLWVTGGGGYCPCNRINSDPWRWGVHLFI